MNTIKTAIIALITALALSAIQFWVAIHFSFKILWQVTLLRWLAGPGPLLGYSENGKPIYEGTPVHLAAAYTGVFVGLLLYAVIVYLLLKWRHNQIIKRTESASS